MIPIACTAILALTAIIVVLIYLTAGQGRDHSELLREPIVEVRALRTENNNRLGSQQGGPQ